MCLGWFMVVRSISVDPVCNKTKTPENVYIVPKQCINGLIVLLQSDK